MQARQLIAAVTLVSVIFAGCTSRDAADNDQSLPETAEGVLYAYAGFSDLVVWDRDPAEFPDTHQLFVVPSPEGVSNRPPTCDVSTDGDPQNVSCAVVDAPKWLTPGRANGEIDFDCLPRWAPAADHDRGSYYPVWAIHIQWENGPVPERAEAFAEWSLATDGPDGEGPHVWNGTASPCFQYQHSDRIVPPTLDLLNVTWEASDHAVSAESDVARFPFVPPPGNCLRIAIIALVDEYGYRVSIESDSGVVWEHMEDVDPARTSPEEQPEQVVDLTGFTPFTTHELVLQHARVPPPSADLAQTVVEVVVTLQVWAPCDPSVP